MAGLPFLYQDFSGGLNTHDYPYLLVDNESRDLQNVNATTAGSLVKRNGLVTFSSPVNTLDSLVSAEVLSPTVMIGAGNGSIYKISSGGVATSIGSGFTAGKRWEIVQAPTVSAQGPIFMMNGADTPQRWDGAAAGTSAWTNASGGVAVPNGKYLIVAQNQLFVSGVTSTPSRVYWSAIADPTNWDAASLTGAGFMDFDPNDGQAISALGHVGPYVLVAKPRKLWVLIDPATATARRISDNVGVAAHRSVAAGAEGTYFLSEDRVYVTNGTKVSPISDKIQPTIDSMAGPRSQASGAYLNTHYYLSLPLTSGTTNDTTFDFDALLQSWWKHTFGSNQFTIWHPTGAAQLYSAKSTSAIVDQCFAANTYIDNGANFTWAWRGPWQSPTFYRRRRFPTPYFRKRLRQVRYDGTGQVDFSLAKDFAVAETLVASDVFNAAAQAGDTWAGGTGLFGDSSTFGGVGLLGRNRSYSLGVANAFSIVFSCTSNQSAEVTSYTLMMTDRKDSVA